MTQTMKATGAAGHGSPEILQLKEVKLRYLLSEVLDICKEGKLKTTIDRQFLLEKVLKHITTLIQVIKNTFSSLETLNTRNNKSILKYKFLSK
jgi:hypothetical protein